MATADKASTRDRLLDAAAEPFYRDGVSAEPAYQGCPCLAALVELKDPEYPASVVARAAKERLEGFFHAQAEQGGARDPELLARQLMLVFDGAAPGRARRSRRWTGWPPRP
ncbi:hypothetical protein [Streptomyces cyaneus]|uniref:hypothetical protein n=1 Tax=Streptomyces cyaneus TaxID=1904 RepID=UPI003CCC7890